MHRDSDRYRMFSRRAAIFLGGQVVLLSGLGARMYYLQVVEAERYQTLANDNRISLKLLAPPRGLIVDRFGRSLADNRQNYRLILTPENITDLDKTLDSLSAIVPIGPNERLRIAREIKRRRRFNPIIIRENLEWNKVARIEVNAPDLAGIGIDVGESRYYPGGAATAPILGYVSGVSEKERTGDPLLELPGFRIGKAGIEKTQDLALRGAAGTSQVEVNAFGREIRELQRVEGQPGAEARLTIDYELQRMVAARLGDNAASAVVMDIHSGEILAMASTPSFDSNAFKRGFSRAEWRDLISNPRAPLNNKAVVGQYAPGSTFKMIVALAALEKGIITPQSRFFCSGEMELGDSTFHCWKRTGHGSMGLVNGITQSCDVYFYEVARRTGIDRISAMARRFGLGSRLGIELPGEKNGLMPTRKWKKRAKGVRWQQGETVLAGIGQGFLLTTPLQLAVMISRLANGGRAVEPSILRQLVSFGVPEPEPGELPQFPEIGVNKNHLRIVGRAMARVTNSPIGTAYRARIKNPEFRMAGKTGTVQVRRITKAEREQGVRKNSELEWRDRDHALFVGYGPVRAPRYAVAVVVEHGGGGSTAAAPIARDILTEAQVRDPSRGRAASLSPRRQPAGPDEG
ncbi:MAG: penicillin-binding protein 2 [Rhodospirillaceae bacterium]|nr:penicillin-binding protein 2 [Rhodospirillaceae bacterium]MBT4115461.1 penicillin-binding protein 2 [Rhodospirillaceae bacterium]MBT4751576.1 penicillin-binding protein 2 [Rhodospirillaceae bacterium]MBT5178254.1 penicillin-binding protein 2 [Rhodospirillaceae bacterium]MBT5841778.1 penicillin-binding protein 2 [Rhodospirillaceae bacterium]